MKKNLYNPGSKKLSSSIFWHLIVVLVIFSFTLLQQSNFSGNTGYFLKNSHGNVKNHNIRAVGLNTLRFERNHGQTVSDADFLCRSRQVSLKMSGNEVIISSDTHSSLKVRMQLPGSNEVNRGEGINKLGSITNYLIGNDPEEWIIKVPNYEKVKYRDVYPGIDLVYHGNDGELEFDFEVSPGKDPGVIKIRFPKEHYASIKENGNIVLLASRDSITISRPVAYQVINGDRKRIAACFVKDENNTFGFQLDKYDPTIPLIIDPVVSFATLLSNGAQVGKDLTIDNEGYVYVTGGSGDVYVAKFHPENDEFIYATFFGSSDEDYGNAIAVDNEGYAYITGETRFDDFPTKNALQNDFGGTMWVDGDAFIVKLNKDGSDFEFSTYLGGEVEDIGHDIEFDPSGHIVITGETNSSNFPIVSAYQGVLKNYEHEAFITKIKADGSDYVFSTFLGGSSDDAGYDLDLDSEGNIYLTGFTWSQDFYTTENAYITEGESADAFVTKMNPTRDSIMSSCNVFRIGFICHLNFIRTLLSNLANI